MTGAICDGGTAFLRRRIAYCPTEERRRRMVLRVQAWYGGVWYCLGCGDRWEAGTGELGSRPFERSWRKRAVDYARQLWAQAPVGYDREAFHRWLAASL